MIINICGYDVLIDDEDYERVKAIKWYIHIRHGKAYVIKTKKIKKKTIALLLHRFIMNVPEGLFVDHINGNSLDNRKENLRICSIMENSWNSKKRITNTSGYKGVCFDSKTGKWRARIGINYKRIHLGRFDTPEQAFSAYCEAANKYHGEFRRLV